jgi:hypothetical protein
MSRHGASEDGLQRAPGSGRAYFVQWRENLRGHFGPEFWLSVAISCILSALITAGLLEVELGLKQWVSIPAWFSNVETFLLAIVPPVVASRLAPTKADIVSGLPHAVRLLLPPDLSEEFFGDLAERYDAMLKLRGKAIADRWYLRQLLTSVGPLLAGALRRITSGFMSRIIGPPRCLGWVADGEE